MEPSHVYWKTYPDSVTADAPWWWENHPDTDKPVAISCKDGDVLLGTGDHEHHWIVTSPAHARLLIATPNLLAACSTALKALRSYQYGNSSPDLAKEIADHLEATIKKATQD